VLIEQVAAAVAARAAEYRRARAADAGILCVQPQQGELAARMAIIAAVERAPSATRTWSA
jgi:hypothetical protein